MFIAKYLCDIVFVPMHFMKMELKWYFATSGNAEFCTKETS